MVKDVKVILCDMCNKDVTKLEEYKPLTGGCKFLIDKEEFDLCEKCEIKLRSVIRFLDTRVNISIKIQEERPGLTKRNPLLDE